MLTAKRLWKLLYGNKRLFLGAVLATAVSTGLYLLVPLIVRHAVDVVIGGKPSSYGFENVSLFACAAAVVVVTIVEGLFSFLKGKWSGIASENAVKRLKDALYDHIQKLPFEYHVKAQTGDLIQRCTSDVDTVRRFLAAQIIELGRILFMVVFSTSLMFSLHVPLTFSALAAMPFIIAFSLWFSRRIGAMFMRADVKEGELSAVLNENVSGIRVVRAFGRQDFELAKFDEKSGEFRHLIYLMIREMALFWGFSDMMCLAQIGIVLFYGLWLVLNDGLTLGTFIVFNTYVSMLIWPIRSLGRILGDMSRMGVSLERLNEILKTPAEADLETGLTPPLDGDIVFENVEFGYAAEQPVLKGMSFTVKRGETIAILGGTGSGKSTIMHLLTRLYDYDKGSVRINGVELKDIQKKHLRAKVGIVLQEPFLYSKTILENIRMANESATSADIFAATKTAEVHNVIEGFQKGYETMVGEKGVTLSGGQKQRLAIARTLIKNSDVLIFDDSLSAVDTETDLQIRQALKQRREGVTTFIISQRVTTLMDANRIFILSGGKLADCGTHEELIKREGLYQRIWQIQTMEDVE